MKIKSLKLFLFIGILSVNSLALSADSPEHSVFINDSILNKGKTNVIVQVQFDKILKNSPSYPFRQEEVKKYLTQTQVTQSAKYVLEPNKEIKIYEEFIKANHLNDGEWMPTDMSISSDGLNINIDIGGTPKVGDELIKSKKYLVTVLSNGLKVETENTLK